jgi:glyoxalase-like protein
MSKSVGLARMALMLLATGAAAAAATPQVEFDHVWIMVSPNAPERAALERAGFQISPDINRHEGQGTASITVEFQNAYLELIWPDATVPVEPGLERAAEKFRQRMLWRTSGWCPIGVGLHRVGKPGDPFPFPTWSWTADWMPKGSVMEMLTPRDDTRSPALFVEPAALTDTTGQAARASKFHHPIGVHRITGIRLVSPKTYQPIDALTYLEKQHVVGVERGEQWLLELTFDGGEKKKSKDLRPDLPLVVRY